MKNVLAIFIISMLVGCGVEESSEPMAGGAYSLRIENLNYVSLSCTKTVNGETETFDIQEERDIIITSENPNDFIYISCQKKDAVLGGVNAYVLRDGEKVGYDGCERHFCTVTVSWGDEPQ